MSELVVCPEEPPCEPDDTLDVELDSSDESWEASRLVRRSRCNLWRCVYALARTFGAPCRKARCLSRVFLWTRRPHPQSHLTLLLLFFALLLRGSTWRCAREGRGGIIGEQVPTSERLELSCLIFGWDLREQLKLLNAENDEDKVSNTALHAIFGSLSLFATR